MAQLNISTPFNIDLQYSLAPLPKRFLAWLIDFVIQLAYILLVAKLSSTTLSEASEDTRIVLLFLLYSPVLFYHLAFELSCKGQSPGKMLLGIRVISKTSENASFSQLFIRWIMRSIDNSFFMLYYLTVMFVAFQFFQAVLFVLSLSSFILLLSNATHQKLGDLAANTVVVVKRMPFKFSETIFKVVDTQTYVVTFPEVMKLSDKDLNIINNILAQNRRGNMAAYMTQVADKIKSHLEIQSTLPDPYFLEKLLDDYNYLTQKDA